MKSQSFSRVFLPALWLLALPVAVHAQDYQYTINEGTVTITDYTGAGGAVTIPAMIESLPVTSIGEEAFYNGHSVSSVTIPDSVTSLGVRAFSNSGLISVTIPDGITSLPYSLFGSCSRLTSVTIPDSVNSIGGRAFEWCANLTSVTIPDSVTSIGDRAFSYCPRLTFIFFEGNAPQLEKLAFEYSDRVDIFHLVGATGWGPTYGGRPTRLTTGEVDPLIGGTNLDLVETWFGSGWFGSYSTMFAPWLYHIDHGFIYRYPPSSNASMYIWDIEMHAWWWTNSDIFPWIFAFDPLADNNGTDIGPEWLFTVKVPIRHADSLCRRVPWLGPTCILILDSLHLVLGQRSETTQGPNKTLERTTLMRRVSALKRSANGGLTPENKPFLYLNGIRV